LRLPMHGFARTTDRSPRCRTCIGDSRRLSMDVALRSTAISPGSPMRPVLRRGRQYGSSLSHQVRRERTVRRHCELSLLSSGIPLAPRTKLSSGRPLSSRNRLTFRPLLSSRVQRGICCTQSLGLAARSSQANF
jgi:hypothetical protein